MVDIPLNLTLSTGVAREIMGYTGTLINQFTANRHIPAEWPTTGTVRRVEAHVHAVHRQGQEYVNGLGVTAVPNHNENVPQGTHSGVHFINFDAIGTGGAQRARYNAADWSTFVANYFAIPSSTLGVNRVQTTAGWSSFSPSTYLDIRARVRKSNLTSTTGIDRILGQNSVAAFMFSQRGNTGQGPGTVWLDYRTPAVPSVIRTVHATPAELGLTNNEWQWLRVTTSPDQQVRFYRSLDGASWTLRKTVAAPFDDAQILTTTTQPLRLGSTSTSGEGFDGDIGPVEIRNTGGSVIIDNPLPAIQWERTHIWTTAGGVEWQRGTGPFDYAELLNSTTTGTHVARFTFDSPKAWDAFRVVVTGRTDMLLHKLVLDTGARGWVRGHHWGQGTGWG